MHVVRIFVTFRKVRFQPFRFIKTVVHLMKAMQHWCFVKMRSESSPRPYAFSGCARTDTLTADNFACSANKFPTISK